jgi:molybdopterin-guanine dinucleotide biosynthesis protein A
MLIAGAVLCGGASRRMGRDKATLPVDGTAMAVRVARSLEVGGCAPVFAVGGERGALGGAGLSAVVLDGWPGEGPVGGILTALAHTATDAVLVVACDMPWFSPASARAMVEGMTAIGTGVVVAASDGRQPLIALWHRDTEEIVRQMFEAGERRVRALFEHVAVTEVSIDASSALNVNRPEDLNDAPPAGEGDPRPSR